MTTEPADRRDALLATKLRVLAGHHWQNLDQAAEAASFPGGARLVEPGGRGWILLEGDGARRLGGALALADRKAVDELHLLVDDPGDATVLARRAALVGNGPTVWRIDGTDLIPVEPGPAAVDEPPAPEAELYRPVLVEAGLAPVVEGGHLLGERLGLEVARVVVDERGSRVEAGVGRFDREAGAMMFAELSETDALARVVDLVTAHRRHDAARHPVRDLVPERWLRAAVVAQPEMVGAAELRPVGSAVARANLYETTIASAVGVDADGEPVVVSCSTGVHLDLVPSAADDRLTHAPDARLVLAVPERDAVAVTTELAARLLAPATVVSIPDGWQATPGAI